MTIRGGKPNKGNTTTRVKESRGGDEGRVLMEGDIGRSYIITSVKKVHLVALLCLSVAYKYPFESARGEFR